MCRVCRPVSEGALTPTLSALACFFDDIKNTITADLFYKENMRYFIMVPLCIKLLAGCGGTIISQVKYEEPLSSVPSAIALVRDQTLYVMEVDERGCYYQNTMIHHQNYRDDGIEASYRIKSGIKQTLVHSKQFREGSCGKTYTFVPKEGAKYRFNATLTDPEGSFISNMFKKKHGVKCNLYLMEEAADGAIAPVFTGALPVCGGGSPVKAPWIFRPK